MKFRFAIDRGGTFCDVFWTRGQEHGVLKLLSEDPSYQSAPIEGIRRVLEAVTGERYPRGEPMRTDAIESVRMGTTVATNALLERKGARTALLVTAGFADVLHIGSQARPLIFDLKVQCPTNLYEAVVEVEERLVLVKQGETPAILEGTAVVTGTTGEKLHVLRSPDVAAVRAALLPLKAAGITSIAIAFLHAATYGGHEAAVAAVARELGFEHVSVSHEVMPMVKLVPRGFTAVADAYLTPHIQRYIKSFKGGFVGGLSDVSNGAAKLLFMQSDGALCDVKAFSGHRAILSGPAGGVIGFASTAWDACGKQPLVAFDMGGTSTDVARFHGQLEHTFESVTAGVTIMSPQLDVNTVAAGGGSRLFYRSGLYVVGPESAGAHPGPVCYRKGGMLAITDANLLLGRIVPDVFPHIFGPLEDEPLDADASRAAFQAIADEIQASTGVTQSLDEIAAGFIAVANEAMCRPIRTLTQMRGFDLSQHVLACFGGAGPQHACGVAAALGVKAIFISAFSSVLSAYGIALADVVQEAQEPSMLTLARAGATPPEGVVPRGVEGGPVDDALASALAAASPSALPAGIAAELARRVQALTASAVSSLSSASVDVEVFLNLRFVGTDTAVMTLCPPVDAQQSGGEGSGSIGLAPGSYFSSADLLGSSGVTLLQAAVEAAPTRFVRSYKREFGFMLRGRDIIVDDVRVRASARDPHVSSPATSVVDAKAPALPLPTPSFFQSAYFPGGSKRVSAPVFMLPDLTAGHIVAGPALLLDKQSTLVVDPGFTARIVGRGDVYITADGKEGSDEGTAAPSVASAVASPTATAALEVAIGAVKEDPVRLSVFGHRFMGIAEQMGRTLQRTSISTNIKERLDYSCAIFGPDGGLVANAPFIPVHLGAMQDAVRFQLNHWGAGGISEGDVLVSNHPQLAGGSHLPDITVISPVFEDGRVAFFVASRGHHADIGGIAPGSMPPHSTSLAEEGAAIVAFKLVRNGVFDEAGVTALLLAPAAVPGCTGSRNLPDCISDLRAQVAANTRGITLVGELIEEQGLPVVVAYMRFIQAAAERAVRAMLKEFAAKCSGGSGAVTVTAEDFLDDGSPIRLQITIDGRDGSAVFDFTGTGSQVRGNLNAPRAVTYSAVIYCLRSMIGLDVPLNQGCLSPVKFVIPEGSLLHPDETAAVVGGNVLTSQRVVDVVLKAFRACAASQGCMNNLTFGTDAAPSFGFYTTLAGGAGAGPGWHGRSGVHSHMTNTRITDVEILERRYPVVLQQFRLRSGSGGAGRWTGGEGLVYDLLFRRSLQASILSERRALQPYGMAGGGPGARGLNTLIARSGRRVNVGGKASLSVAAGDRLLIETPGGGGYGPSDDGQAPPSGGETLRPELAGRAGGSLAALATAQADF
jgi:5-oxoprolinase (ATP-hydrolysing)